MKLVMVLITWLAMLYLAHLRMIVCVCKGYGSICFGSPNDVINADDLKRFVQGYGLLKKGVKVCLDQARGNIARPWEEHNTKKQGLDSAARPGRS